MKFTAITLAIVLSAFLAYAFLFVEEGAVQDYVGIQVCTDLAAITSTRPSSLEVNNVASRREDMSKTDAIVWATYYGNITEAQRSLLDRRYDDGDPYQRSVVFVDFSFDRGVGSARSAITCTFVDDKSSFALRSVSQDNETIQRDAGGAAIAMASPRLDPLWRVDDIGLMDRFGFIAAQAGVNLH